MNVVIWIVVILFQLQTYMYNFLVIYVGKMCLIVPVSALRRHWWSTDLVERQFIWVFLCCISVWWRLSLSLWDISCSRWLNFVSTATSESLAIWSRISVHVGPYEAGFMVNCGWGKYLELVVEGILKTLKMKRVLLQGKVIRDLPAEKKKRWV